MWQAPAALLALLFLFGPAVEAAERVTVGILPVEAVNLSRAERDGLLGQLRRALQRHPRIGLRDASGEPLPRECSAELECLRQRGRRLGVEKLLALRAGRVLDTLVLRLTAFDVTRGLRQGSWQEVLRRADGQAISLALDRMITAFLPLPPPRRAWYARHWWIWPVVGAVVAGSVTAAVLLTRDNELPVDYVIRLF